MHADNGSIRPQQIVVMCNVHDVNSDKVAHR
jgi:hypothetical protein